MNGEGSGKTSSEVVSSDPIDDLLLPWQHQKSDGGDESPVYSQYSSGGDSEFERYCSANSVMGTASLCSSIGTFQECGDSEFGSTRSFGLGDVDSSENFNLSGRFSQEFRGKELPSSSGLGCLSDHIIDSCEGKNVSEVRNDGEGQGLVGINDASMALDGELYIEDDGGAKILSSDQISNIGTRSSTRVEMETHPHINIVKVNSSSDELNSQSVEELDGREGEQCLDEDSVSSKFEHSEGEDSMFGYGTDDEQKMDLLHQRKMLYKYDTKVEKENSLLMGSSVAFGSDDWDDFDQETREPPITSIFLEKRESNIVSERNNFGSSQIETGFPSVGPDQEVVKDASVATNQIQGAENGCPFDFLDFCETERGKDADDILVTNNAGDLDESVNYPKTCSGNYSLQREKDVLSQEAHLMKGLNFMDANLRKSRPILSNQELNNGNNGAVSECQESDKSTVKLDPLSAITVSQDFPASTETPEDQWVGFLREPQSLLPMDESNMRRPLKDSHALFNHFEDHSKSAKPENLELNEFYNEVVHDMEEILMDSSESPGARFRHGDTANQSHFSLPSRDGGSTASTSGNADTYLPIQFPPTIDGVEVIGAKQKKGDVSFGERLVGVKEYTVYIIRVWSGNDHWEVERRYRDFCTLYRRLKTLFDSQGWTLPSPWASVERESRKIFGSVSPDIVAERSALIQECLQSILHSRLPFPSGFPSALLWFFSPPKVIPSSPASDTRPHFSAGGLNTDNTLTLGKTISLIVEIRPYKSIKQILEAQHYTCAGCHKHFEDGKTRVLEFVQTLGWGKPRLCEYTGQLFCSSCHTNEVAVLPARVLHHWDFTQCPVSQLAKSYLDSIHDQPMLCVSAVNPILFSKVPALLQVTGVRKRLGAMLPYIRCPFRRSIYNALGSRRYLLESNDFFALRDLIDLSKGVFAVLPAMVDTVARKILEHITEQCLVCCDVGVPCNARQACDDPSCLIFPFQVCIS
ncbi:hypothetical protein U1Q18_035459 [Sarracenia purpurea var. burkii]